jgi:hypothetical protein
MAAGIPLDVLNKATLGVVRENMAARCPAESQADVMVSIFNDPRQAWCRRRHCACHTVHVCIHIMYLANTAQSLASRQATPRFIQVH